MFQRFKGRPNPRRGAPLPQRGCRAIARRQTAEFLPGPGADGSVTFRQRKRLSGPEKRKPAFELISLRENHS